MRKKNKTKLYTYILTKKKKTIMKSNLKNLIHAIKIISVAS